MEVDCDGIGGIVANSELSVSSITSFVTDRVCISILNSVI